MAIAGGAVPVAQVTLKEGKVSIGYCGFANGQVVEENMLIVIQRLRAGETVTMHRYGCNYSIVEFVIRHNLVESPDTGTADEA